MKKIISVSLALIMFFSMCVCMTGCNSSGSDTLVWYVPGDKPQALEEVLSEANKIIEQEIGMKLDMQYIDDASFAEKMRLKMASHDTYDLTFAGYLNNYQSAVYMGGLYDITELIKETELDTVIPQYYIDMAEINGKIYGIPNIQVMSNPQSVTILESVADECGIKPIAEEIEEKSVIGASLEEIQEVINLYDKMFGMVHEKRPDLYTWNPAANLAVSTIYEHIASGVGIRRDGTSNELVILQETEEWKAWVAKVREWYNKGYIRMDIASVGSSLKSADERKLVAFATDTWKPGQDAYEKQQYGESFVHIKCTKPYIGRQSGLSTMIAVGANSKHPKEAVEFIKLINSRKDLYNLICWGIEGKHFNKNDNGTVSEIADSGYNIGKNAWKYGNQFNGYVTEGQSLDIWEQTEKMNNEADKSPIMGFVPNTDIIATETANVTSVSSEYSAKENFGTADMSEWYDEYNIKMDEAGIHKVRDELQRQYDEWLSSKQN